MLFHYHFWTPYVEETEAFYRKLGFRVTQRIGKQDGSFSEYNPPLEWDDFRGKNILFRIIEMRYGSVNVTFGYGKKPIFDHIGFLVSETEAGEYTANAREMGWNVQSNERRTFITTPYGFRIELQNNMDAVEDVSGGGILQNLTLIVPEEGLEADLAKLFGSHPPALKIRQGENAAIESAAIKGVKQGGTADPNGVEILRMQGSSAEPK